jgi:phage-related baseplate assembly protein
MVSSIATSPAIDLSRLPPPQIIDQPDFETRFDAKLARLIALLPEFSALVESDPAYKLIEADAYDEMALVQAFVEGATQNLLAYARGANLDNLAAFYGLTRQEITPANPLTGAPAVMESDADLRERTLLAPHTYSVAGPERAYVGFARNAHPDVLDASAVSPAPTEVVVSVLSRTGDGTAPPVTLAAVTAALDDDVRPMTDLVTVQSAEIINYDIVANLYRYAGPDPQLLLDTAEASLNAYLESARRLGRDVPRSALIAALHVGGIQRVELSSPAADVVLTAMQAGYPLTITINDAGIAD